MVEITSFYKEHTDIITKALDFTEKKIYEYYIAISKKLGSSHKAVINKKVKEEANRVIRAKELLKKYPDANRVTIGESSLKEIADTIRSSLEIYREEISQVALKYDIEDYTKAKNEIEQKILKTEILANAQSNLFNKFQKSSIDKTSNLEIFISYSSKDKKLAGKVRDIIKKDNIEVFLAHRDIPLSEEWRNEIPKKLESCSHLIAICTENYQCSAWGNQEVGIALEKKKKIIPIFAKGTDKTRFGFLEARQGYPKEFTEENIENMIEKIIEKVLL